MKEKLPETIGWNENVELEEGEQTLAHDDHVDGTAGCCATAFHVVTSEDEFQALLKGLQSDGKF